MALSQSHTTHAVPDFVKSWSSARQGSQVVRMKLVYLLGIGQALVRMGEVLIANQSVPNSVQRTEGSSHQESGAQAHQQPGEWNQWILHDGEMPVRFAENWEKLTLPQSHTPQSLILPEPAQPRQPTLSRAQAPQCVVARNPVSGVY